MSQRKWDPEDVQSLLAEATFCIGVLMFLGWVLFK